MMKMKLTQLSNVRDLLAKAELAKRLLKYCSEDQIKVIIHFLLEGGINFHGKRVDYCFSEVEIRAYDDPLTFGREAATLKDSSFEHSWAGCDETIQHGWVIIGDVDFGESSYSQYSQNGDSRSPNEYYIPPDFSIKENQVVLIRTQVDDTFNNRDYHDVSWCLHIYQPIEYNPPQWVIELAEKFDW